MYTNKPIVLPNQKVTSSSNLLLYKDNTIKLTKQSSSAKFTNTSPKIDGNIDSMWNSASELKIQRQVSNWGLVPTATNGTAKLLWDNNFLYALIQVKDLKISYSYKGGLGDMWRRDSVDVFVDVPNDHKTIPSLWTPKQYLMSVCVNGEFLVKGSQDVDITDDFTGIQKSVKMVSGGYIVEIKLPWHPLVKGLVSDNRVIGVDMQINDDKGSGDRDSMVVWNDRTGNAFRWSDVLGDIKLIK
jgi:endo-1,4-beta-xylanase